MNSTQQNSSKTLVQAYNQYILQKQLMDKFIIEHWAIINSNPEIMKFLDGYNIRQAKFSRIIAEYGKYIDSIIGCYMNTNDNLFFLDKLIRKYTPNTNTKIDKYIVDL